MARISKYAIDSNITGIDKLVGTDADDNDITKNFEISDLTTYISEQLLGNGTTTIDGNLVVQQDQADATITIISDASNQGEQHNPSIRFIQDGGAQNAAIGFNIIDDTAGGTIPGSGNRFWIVNAMDDTIGDGGITFGTINVDGWQNAIGRFMIRGDGKGLFGHPNENRADAIGSQFEVYDDRTENTTTDYSLSVYGVVDVSEYPPEQGAGGIISRIKVLDGGTDLGVHSISLVAGTTSSEIMASGALAFYASSDMDTHSAVGFAGNITTAGGWNISDTFQTVTPSELSVKGDIEATEIGDGFILKSPSGQRWKIQVDDSGNLFTQLLAQGPL